MALREAKEAAGLPTYRDLLKKLRQESERVKLLQDAAAAAAEKLAKAEAELSELSKLHEQKEAELRAEIQRLNEEIEAEHKSKAELEAELEAALERERNGEEHTAFKRKLQGLEDELSGKRAALADATKKAADSEQDVAKLQAEGAALKKKVEELEKALQEAKNKPAPPVAEKKGCC